MKLTVDDVKYVANLARLKFGAEEEGRFVSDMEDIIGFADMLGEVDTEGVDPTFHAINLQNVLREDVVTNLYDREALLQNAPGKMNGCFEVPKVVE